MRTTQNRNKLAIAVLLVIGLVNCGQSQASLLVRIVGNSLTQLETLDPANAGAYSKASGIMLKVSDDIANWKTGQPTDEIVQGLNDAVAILVSVHVTDNRTQALIILAVSTAESIIDLYPGVKDQVTVRAERQTLPAGSVPKSAADYKAKWNSMAPVGAQLK